jgi:hypothetical protein
MDPLIGGALISGGFGLLQGLFSKDEAENNRRLTLELEKLRNRLPDWAYALLKQSLSKQLAPHGGGFGGGTAGSIGGGAGAPPTKTGAFANTMGMMSRPKRTAVRSDQDVLNYLGQQEK